IRVTLKTNRAGTRAGKERMETVTQRERTIQPPGGTRHLAVDRRLYILDRIAAQGSVRLQALAEELGTSVMTVRRDVKRLEEDGFLRRSYGGATPDVRLA